MPIWDLLGEGRAPRLYSAGQMIYLQDTEPDCFYYLKQGAARSFISSPSGDERVITVHHSGDLMGEASFFDQCPRVTSNMAVTDCLVYSVNRSQLDQIFAHHPELALPMLQYLARTVRILSSHVNSSSLPAEQRIARYLLEQAPEQDGTIRCTHEEVGQAVGVSRVTVSRVLSGFSRDGAVDTGYGSLKIRDRALLKRMTER